MDKTWVHFERNTNEYRDGVKKFLKLAIENTGLSNLRCPCIKCQNHRRNSEEIVEEHLVIFGMDPTYTNWAWHGEPLYSMKSGPSKSDKQEMCSDAYLHDDFFPNTVHEENNSEFTEFLEKRLLKTCCQWKTHYLSKRRKKENLAIQAALRKNSNAGVRIFGKQSGESGDDIVRSLQSQRNRYTEEKNTKSKKVKETQKKRKQPTKTRKNIFPSEDFSDEDYTERESEDGEFSDRDLRNDDCGDEDSSDNGSSSEIDSSEGEENIPNSGTKYNKMLKQKSKMARNGGLSSDEDASENEQDDRDQASPYGNSEDTPSTKESHKSQKPRGPTKPSVVLDSSLKKKVLFNDRGQPIGENSIAYSTELGSIARDMVPLTFDDWRSVDKGHKEIYWDTLMKKYIVDEALGKSYTLQSIGKLWRAYKSRLRRKIRDYKKQNGDIQTLKPDTASDAEWAYFVRKLLNKDFKKKSKKYRDMRKKQNFPHTCGRRGYARLEEKMKKESSDPSSIAKTDVWMEGHTKGNGEPSNENVVEKMRMIREIRDLAPTNPSQETVRNDPLLQVLGPERSNGHVRAVGKGVTQSKLGVLSQKSAIITQLQDQVSSLSANVAALTTLIESQNQFIRILMANNQVNSSNPISTNGIDSSAASLSNTPIVTRLDGLTAHFSVPNDSIVIGGLRQVSKCKLLNWAVPNEVVAIGRWDTSDPNTLVHGKPLGQNASCVWVEDIIQPLTPLWRKTIDDEMTTIANAKDTRIAWPTDHIGFFEDN